MMAKHNAKGRSKGTKYVKLDKWMLDTEAYRSLHPYARALLVEFDYRFNGANNSRIHMGVREAQKVLGVGRKAAYRGLRELLDRGFIVVTKKGFFTVREATEYRLTWRANVGDRPTKEFRLWGQ